MSTPFANPWSNPHNPVDMFRRYRRRKARREEQKQAPADNRTRDVDDNLAYESTTAGNAQAQQSYFSTMLEPWGEFLGTPKAPTSKWPRSKRSSSSTTPKPSSTYDPSDWFENPFD